MPGRGYRFIGPVVTEIENGATSSPQADIVPGPAPVPRVDAERRQITASCCELTGISGRGAGADLEDLREEVAPPGDSDVTSQALRDSSSETKIAPRSVRIAAGASRGASSGMFASRVGGPATSLSKSDSR